MLKKLLQEAGVAPALIELACQPHETDIFFFRCAPSQQDIEKFSFSSTAPGQYPEDIPVLIMWQCEEWATGVRVRPQGPEYVTFDVGNPQLWQVIAHGPQGVLANLFADLAEDEDWDENPQEAWEALQAAAAACGFNHLQELMEKIEAYGEDDDYAELLAQWTTTLDR